MRYGVCVEPYNLEEVAIAKAAGYDYIEATIKTLVKHDIAEIEGYAKELKRQGIACESGNCFIRDGLKVVGETVNTDEICKYLDDAMEKCAVLGMKTIVYGSGGSRNYEDGFSVEEAHRQCADFLRNLVAPRAQRFGIKIAIEPLAFNASRMIHFVRDGVQMARDSGSGVIGGLADIYHMEYNGDKVSDILLFKGEMYHSHISDPLGRKFPFDVAEYDYKGYIDALKETGCPRCTIEADTKDFANDAVKAYKLLSSLD